MNTTMTTAHGAGAQQTCAQTNLAQTGPVLRRDLLRWLRKTRSRLGLSSGDILALDALLSFLPCWDKTARRDRGVDSGILLVIYASNAAIADRTGMPERSFRKNVERLAQMGFVARRESATGKRFPIRNGGNVVDAFGIDLSPLVARANELRELTAEIEAEEEERRSIRSLALAIRARLLDRATGMEAEVVERITAAKTVLRRVTLPLCEARQLLAWLRDLDANFERPTLPADDLDHTDGTDQYIETEDSAAGNGRSCRHIETHKIETKTCASNKPTDIWQRCTSIHELHPREPRSTSELAEVVYLMGSYMGLKERPLAEAIAAIGWGRLLLALDYMIANAARITRPDGYLMRIVEQAKSGKPDAGYA